MTHLYIECRCGHPLQVDDIVEAIEHTQDGWNIYTRCPACNYYDGPYHMNDERLWNVPRRKLMTLRDQRNQACAECDQRHPQCCDDSGCQHITEYIQTGRGCPTEPQLTIYDVIDRKTLVDANWMFGIEHHRRQIDEEIGEFFVADNHTRRARNDVTTSDIAEEIADCIVSFAQYGVSINEVDKINATIVQKMKRLQDRIKTDNPDLK